MSTVSCDSYNVNRQHDAPDRETDGINPKRFRPNRTAKGKPTYYDLTADRADAILRAEGLAEGSAALLVLLTRLPYADAGSGWAGSLRQLAELFKAKTGRGQSHDRRLMKKLDALAAAGLVRLEKNDKGLRVRLNGTRSLAPTGANEGSEDGAHGSHEWRPREPQLAPTGAKDGAHGSHTRINGINGTNSSSNARAREEVPSQDSSGGNVEGSHEDLIALVRTQPGLESLSSRQILGLCREVGADEVERQAKAWPNRPDRTKWKSPIAGFLKLCRDRDPVLAEWLGSPEEVRARKRILDLRREWREASRAGDRRRADRALDEHEALVTKYPDLHPGCRSKAGADDAVARERR